MAIARAVDDGKWRHVLAEIDRATGSMTIYLVCKGTLKDAQTDITELYQWQTDGPFRYDFAGRKPVGKRDAGALEAQ